MDGGWWVGMGLTWHIKEVGYKGWHEMHMHDKYYLIVWIWLVCGQYVISWNL